LHEFTALLLLTGGLLLSERAIALLAIIARLVVSAVAARSGLLLLNLHTIHYNTLRFQGLFELIQAMAQQAGGIVVGGLKCSGDGAIAHLNRHLQRAKLRRIESNLHRPASSL